MEQTLAIPYIPNYTILKVHGLGLTATFSVYTCRDTINTIANDSYARSLPPIPLPAPPPQIDHVYATLTIYGTNNQTRLSVTANADGGATISEGAVKISTSIQKKEVSAENAIDRSEKVKGDEDLKAHIDSEDQVADASGDSEITGTEDEDDSFLGALPPLKLNKGAKKGPKIEEPLVNPLYGGLTKQSASD